MIKIFNYFWQAIFIYFFFILGRILGIRLSRKLFSYLFLYLGQIFKSKKTIQKNLRIFLKNNPQFNEKKIISEMWKNYGKTFIEYIYLNQLRKNNTHINLIGEENLSLILKDKKPVIFVSGHFANFELMSMEITKKNIKLATIYRPLNNIFLNPFMEYLRKTFVCKNQIKKGINGVRDAINFIKNDHSIALMIDQRVSEGDKINFFNEGAFTTTLPAQLALKFQLNIVPVFIERKNDDTFNIEFKRPINSKNFQNKITLSNELNKILEQMIIKNPSQWIWTHNRWK
jgi:KDO2-lipid IV(A) lauroyltransferase